MKKISLIFLLALLIGCSNKKVQSNPVNENQEQINTTDDINPELLLEIEKMFSFEGLDDAERETLLEQKKAFELLVKKC